jgi:hypothetical protein
MVSYADGNKREIVAEILQEGQMDLERVFILVCAPILAEKDR